MEYKIQIQLSCAFVPSWIKTKTPYTCDVIILASIPTTVQPARFERNENLVRKSPENRQASRTDGFASFSAW